MYATKAPRTAKPRKAAPKAKATPPSSAPARIQAQQQHVINLPLGLLGLERLKKFSLVGRPQEAPLLWLKVEDDSGLAFVVVPPDRVFPGYRPDVSAQDANFLGLTNPKEALVLNIVTLSPHGLATVNLKGPIVINARTCIGKQVIPNNAVEYSTQHPLPVAKLVGNNVLS